MNFEEYAEHGIAGVPVSIRSQESLWLVQFSRPKHPPVHVLVRPEHVIKLGEAQGLLRVRVESPKPVLGSHGAHAQITYWGGPGPKQIGWAPLESLKAWPEDKEIPCEHLPFRNWRDITCTRCGRQLKA